MATATMQNAINNQKFESLIDNMTDWLATIDEHNSKANAETLKKTETQIKLVESYLKLATEAATRQNDTDLKLIGSLGTKATYLPAVVSDKEKEPEEAQKDAQLTGIIQQQTQQSAVANTERKTFYAQLMSSVKGISSHISSLVKHDEAEEKEKRSEKIDALKTTVKPAEKTKEMVEGKESIGPIDTDALLGGLGKIFGSLFNPVAMVAAFIAKTLPWLLIFGALLIGFIKEASWELIGTIISWVAKIAIPIAAALVAIKVIKFAFIAAATVLKESWMKLVVKPIQEKIQMAAAKFIAAGWNALANTKLGKLLHMKTFTAEQLLNKQKQVNVAAESAILKTEAVQNKTSFLATMKNKFIERKNAVAAFRASMVNNKLERKNLIKDAAMRLKTNLIDLKNKIVQHTTEMFHKTKEFALSIVQHVVKMFNIQREAVMDSAEHSAGMLNIVKDAIMKVTTHLAEMAQIAWKYMMEAAKYVREMIPITLKIVQAIALFAMEIVRIVFQIASTYAQYLLIAAAMIVVVAIIAGIAILIVKVVGYLIKEIAAALMTIVTALMPLITAIITPFINVLVALMTAYTTMIATFLSGVMMIMSTYVMGLVSIICAQMLAIASLAMIAATAFFALPMMMIGMMSGMIASIIPALSVMLAPVIIAMTTLLTAIVTGLTMFITTILTMIGGIAVAMVTMLTASAVTIVALSTAILASFALIGTLIGAVLTATIGSFFSKKSPESNKLDWEPFNSKMDELISVINLKTDKLIESLNNTSPVEMVEQSSILNNTTIMPSSLDDMYALLASGIINDTNPFDKMIESVSVQLNNIATMVANITAIVAANSTMRAINPLTNVNDTINNIKSKVQYSTTDNINSMQNRSDDSLINKNVDYSKDLSDVLKVLKQIAENTAPSSGSSEGGGSSFFGSLFGF